MYRTGFRPWLAAVVAGVLAIACNASAASPAPEGGDDQGLAGSQASTAQRDRMARLLGGFPVWIPNGSALPVGDGMTAELYLAPYPPARRGVLDVYLTSAETGMPVTDAAIDLAAEMTYMDHGIWKSVASEGAGKSASDGHYLLETNFFMYGDWAVTLKLKGADWSDEVRILVAVLP